MSFQYAQPGILASQLPLGRSLSFALIPEADPRDSLGLLRDGFMPEWGVLGVGEPLALALDQEIEGLRTFPALSGPACAIPSSQQAVWILLQGNDRSELFDRGERIKELAGNALRLVDGLDTFTYAGGKDLTGYQDGTENPRGEAAGVTALMSGTAGLEGSSLVAVQRWVHDLERFRRFAPERRDAIIGRRAVDNEEIETAPPSAHVKRTAQESFDPPAFMLRRSMPWASAFEQGLEFIAFGHSLDPFERMLRRMAGLEDGILDGLFSFSRPLSGGYYWCPPVLNERLDLRRLDL
jgi:porphyrinogen peroxidase